MQPANLRGETAKGQKEIAHSRAHSRQCICIMHAPEIHQTPGFGVVNEFFAAIQASDVGFPAKDRMESR
ncbi:MAG: hypothetical protein NVS9B14_06340 [Candidatus Acidiferrum sp.]